MLKQETIIELRKIYEGKKVKHKRTGLQHMVLSIDMDESAEAFAVFDSVPTIRVKADMLPVNWEIIRD